MYELQVQRAHKALGLARQIVGVRFLVMQKEYEDCRAAEVDHTSICSMVREAGNGMRVKAKADNFQCMNAAYAVGLREIPADVSTGREDYRNGRYESLAIPDRSAQISSVLHRRSMV